SDVVSAVLQVYHPVYACARCRRWHRSQLFSTVETMIRRRIARAFWTVSRWKRATEPAPKRPTVLVGAPHTSNWDFVLMLAIAWSLGVEVHWLGKHSLFAGWRGPI